MKDQNKPYFVFLGIGSNIRNRTDYLQSGLEVLENDEKFLLLSVAPLYETEPVGYSDQREFYNSVCYAEWRGTPGQLFQLIKSAEKLCGRKQTFRNGPRTLDIDILFFTESTISSPGLTVPHPRMHERIFVLQPLFDIAPDQVVPGIGIVRDIYAKVKGSAGITMVSENWYKSEHE